jgi:hypothetical protein
MARSSFSWFNFIIRLLFALVLVFASYNPTEYNYYDWALKNYEEFNVLKAFAGVVLLIGWTIFLRATVNSLGFFGIVLALVFFGLLIWLVIDYNLIAADNITAMTWLIEFVIAGVLATGMSWSHIRRRMSGQLDVDETDD